MGVLRKPLFRRRPDPSVKQISIAQRVLCKFFRSKHLLLLLFLFVYNIGFIFRLSFFTGHHGCRTQKAGGQKGHTPFLEPARGPGPNSHDHSFCQRRLVWITSKYDIFVWKNSWKPNAGERIEMSKLSNLDIVGSKMLCKPYSYLYIL